MPLLAVPSRRCAQSQQQRSPWDRPRLRALDTQLTIDRQSVRTQRLCRRHTGRSSSGPSAVPQCWVFARSGRAYQYWPALWEKAYATWKDHDNNTPDYGRIHGGWPATAISELTGRPAQTTTSSKFLAVQRNCPLGYAICPMVASMYAGDTAVYNQGSGISGNHPCTVLGVLNEGERGCQPRHTTR